MHSQSGHSDTGNSSNTNELASNGSTAPLIDDHEDIHSQCLNRYSSSQHLRNHVRIATLQAEVNLLESERETLNDQIVNLKADVENLEEEIASLESTIQANKIRHQKSIDKYESIIDEKNQAYQRLSEKSDNTTTSNTRSVSTVRSLIQSVSGWLKHTLVGK
ncbi:hypothetical protein SAMN05421858_3646 [Haladaptatus litoreus]|uniref:Uncharacterized protein n=1 Tax=Haladaptatus litoreus TaxID=553468 RepID=A0A1N7DIF9_9EURY|nr:hypothetical protein SAMN05421858_3646 [Haladaptatus litoreus]